MTVKLIHQFAPGVGGGSRDCGWNAEFFQNCCRLRSARCYFNFPKRDQECLEIVATAHDIDQGTHTQLGQEDHEIVFATHQSGCEKEGMILGLQADFAHSRNHERLAAILSDKFLNLCSVPCLQCEDAQAC